MQEVGIALRFIMRNLAKQVGSYHKLRFLKQDVNNYGKQLRRDALEYGDAKLVLAYLEGNKSANPSFFVRYTKDKDGSFENLFWCDRQSRIEYKTFGHVPVFDTTYKCNAYTKPLIMLVRVNHNRKTIPFGRALVVHEKEESFIWVSEQLAEAGDGQKPKTVLTDGNKAMANAIKAVFP